MPKGAFRRIGSTDQRCVDDDLWVLRGTSQPLMGPDMAPAVKRFGQPAGRRTGLASLGTPGSRMRNPAIAAVLHEINWAETKGSGIRTMRRLAVVSGVNYLSIVGAADKVLLISPAI